MTDSATISKEGTRVKLLENGKGYNLAQNFLKFLKDFFELKGIWAGIFFFLIQDLRWLAPGAFDRTLSAPTNEALKEIIKLKQLNSNPVHPLGYSFYLLSASISASANRLTI